MQPHHLPGLHPPPGAGRMGARRSERHRRSRGCGIREGLHRHFLQPWLQRYIAQAAVCIYAGVYAHGHCTPYNCHDQRRSPSKAHMLPQGMYVKYLGGPICPHLDR